MSTLVLRELEWTDLETLAQLEVALFVADAWSAAVEEARSG